MKDLVVPDDEVWFYEGSSSNFHKCKHLNINGNKYNNSEGYFQSQKYKGEFATSVDIEYSNLIAEQNYRNYNNFNWEPTHI